MKYKSHWISFAALAALIGWSSPSWGQEAKTAYGIIDKDAGMGSGVYTFDVSSDTLDNVQIVAPLSVDHIMGATMVDNVYYYIDYEQNTKGHKSHGFYSFDLETKNVKKVGDYHDQQQGPAASHFAWDAQTQTMYALNSVQSGNGLVKIDLTNGDLIPVCTFSYDRLTEKDKQRDKSFHTLISIAINYDGDMYGVSYGGALYKVNPVTGLCSLIGELDYNPDQAYMYNNNCLFFDNETGKLYFRFFTFYGKKYELSEIDLKTAHVTHIATLPYETDASGMISKSIGFDGIVMPYVPAEASAPQKVLNLKLTRGEQGELTAKLEWDNPSKTYGRGGTLEDLDSIIIYRDGVEVHRIANPVIGGHETWTDNLPERGYYTYKFVPVNDMGYGDRRSISAYIGVGDPMNVGDLKAEAEANCANITWTAPTEGKFNSWINTTDLTYDVWRMPGNVKLVEKSKETSFTDTTLPVMGKYHYNVIAYAGGYQSDSISTEDIIAGPAFQAPDTLLSDYANFMLWNNIDADGSTTTWTWQPAGLYGQFGGATDNYTYEDYAPQNWLISPRIRMEKDKHYKITFETKTGSDKVQELLAIGFGQGAEISNQDSIYQFALTEKEALTLRVNLPVVENTGDYNFSFVHRTLYKNYNIAIKNVIFAEDHEGYISGRVTCDGKGVSNALVRTENGQFTSRTNNDGQYTLNYLPEGSYNIIVEALGYRDGSATSTVSELETTTENIAIEALPTYSLHGRISDTVGDPVVGATVILSGYNNYETTTAADGSYSISGIYEHTGYTVSVSKNKLLGVSETIDVNANKTLNLTLKDNIKPAKAVNVAESPNGDQTEVTWQAPANDPRVDRIDDGVITTGTGYQNGATNKSTFGVIRREAATVYGAQFYLTNAPGVSHYSIALRILGLKENGDPDEANVLFEETYVPVKDDQWNEYTLPTPVEAPNGYYLCVATASWLGIGIDGGGDTAKYPFQAMTNCFSGDFTSGTYYYLDNQQSENMHRNFMIRPVSAPYSVSEDHITKTGRFMPCYMEKNENEQPTLYNYKDNYKVQGAEPTTPLKTVQNRVRYNVYRLTPANTANEEAWTKLATNLQERSYTDSNWKTLPQGTYYYAVKAIYTGDKESVATLSDSIGNKMLTNVVFNLTTNTTDNEAYGASIVMVNGGGTHTYQMTADNAGVATSGSVWKATYEVHISLDGFYPIDTTITVDKENSYTFSYELIEHKVQPHGLIIENGSYGAQKLFIWNYPEYFEDSFEEHEDFVLNSPGSIGWQYFDGDEGETGAFTFSQDGSKPWPNAFEAMAYIIMNAGKVSDGKEGTLASDYITLAPRSGEKSLQSWPAAGKKEDDWLITPHLHFQEPISFRFYALNFSNNAPEEIEVLYTTSEIPDVEEFIRIDSCTINSAYGSWVLKQYDSIPAEANYIALRRVTPADETGYTPKILNIDDVAFGTKLPNATRYLPKNNVRRMPSLDGAYEVYLDGELVASTDDTQYYFDGLTVGKHTAGVIASYTSGKTTMSTIDFEVDATGVSSITGRQDEGEAEFYNIKGQRISNRDLPRGVYIVKKGGHIYKSIKK